MYNYRLMLEGEAPAKRYGSDAAAIRASIRHWERIVGYIESVGYLSYAAQKLLKKHTVTYYCALCRRHYVHNTLTYSCPGCPVDEKYTACNFITSYYGQFHDALTDRNYNHTLESARNMLKALEALL